ncbi:MAG: hypothetical protein GF349_05065 [Candidatus Magasanikbacteria bacterium]|nr:hypothetical protein [Candidatus Magasanikbacteria bacterium]
MNIAENFVQKKSNKKIIGFTIAVIIILLIAIAIFLFYSLDRAKTDYRGYQAVFLNNGQVYFGKIEKRDSDLVKLVDIYYLQVNQGLQNQDADSEGQPDMSLVKLGNELHGPEDEMEIILENILFIENLSKDSKVLRAIEDYTRN